MRHLPVMNDNNNTYTIAISGNLTVARADLERMLRGLVAPVPASAPQAQTRSVLAQEAGGKALRLAYTVPETAEALGVSKMSVYRLMYRGLLKPSLALRKKMIARSEIERFLKTTTSEV